MTGFFDRTRLRLTGVRPHPALSTDTPPRLQSIPAPRDAAVALRARADRARPELKSVPAADGLRLGLGRVDNRLPSAALRILETTWRLWREPRIS